MHSLLIDNGLTAHRVTSSHLEDSHTRKAEDFFFNSITICHFKVNCILLGVSNYTGCTEVTLFILCDHAQNHDFKIRRQIVEFIYLN